MTKQMTQEEFVATDGDHCPFCRSRNFVHMEVVEDQNFERCYNCGGAFRIECRPRVITGYKLIERPAYDYA